MRSLSTRAVVYSFFILLGLLSALPNVLPEHVLQKLPSWYSSNTLTLGLDLRGGSHLLMEVDTQNLLAEKNQDLADQISAKLRELRIFHSRPEVRRGEIHITPTNPADLEKVREAIRPLLEGLANGTRGYRVEVSSQSLSISASKEFSESVRKDAVERSLEVVRRRLNETGLVDPTITRQGEDGVLVQLPGVDDPAYIRQLLGTTAKMTFHLVADGSSQGQTRVITVPGDGPNERYQLEARVALEGRHISDAQLGFHPDTREPVVNFRLDSEGARRFADITTKNIGRPFAIVLDGKVITAPVIRSAITGGSGEISGNFTSASANDLALLLRAGALPAPLKVIEERTVGPDLGSDSISMGITTGVIGALLVFVFMVVIYGRWGLIACTGLAINIGLVFGILTLFGATLTLPGIAGFILSIGMAVDANILINERIREESLNGNSAYAALDAGFKRAYSTILDSNITSLIAISLLFLFGSGPVRGFAVTMAVGLIISMFTAIAVTRLLMEWRVRKLSGDTLNISTIKALDRLSNRTINFMRGRYIGLAVSIVLSVASAILFVAPGMNYGIDFTGGSVIEVRAPGTSVETLRDSLRQQNFASAAIQEFGETGSYLIRLPSQSAEQVASGAPVEDLKTAVRSVSPDAEFPRVEVVGPKVSGNFSDATILAIVIAGLGMLVYLWIRFESHFAIGATLTLALDMTKTIGFFVLAGVEFNLTAVAALLALIGYSVNDKVVVFDRMREFLRQSPDKPLAEVLNESITSTLTRTIFTSVTTFLAISPMAIAGGDAVASFALPMLFGIVVGTSSSIFIAAPIVLLLGERRIRKGLSQLRPSAEELRQQLDEMP
ncbi:protein translocase subunit SecD [Saccharophagus sp. K07]|uniref:protein translocase subunit SecD n=1 Tax=Saccharophagus sp. K07 TaxID=2283636 RepID=UPI001652AFBD|nr:protein translocase subunit SecD [Saccharophagus sp. K07]MBC6904398.1 protein translocase subunit SecD [Saccharophagus sp. K07]